MCYILEVQALKDSPTSKMRWDSVSADLIRRRSQWPGGQRRRPRVDRLLRPRVRIPPGAWMCVFCGCCELWGKGLCDGPTIRPQYYWLRCVTVCDLETSAMRRPWPALGCCTEEEEEEPYTPWEIQKPHCDLRTAKCSNPMLREYGIVQMKT